MFLFCLHLFSISGRKLSPQSFISKSILPSDCFHCECYRCDDQDRVCTSHQTDKVHIFFKELKHEELYFSKSLEPSN